MLSRVLTKRKPWQKPLWKVVRDAILSRSWVFRECDYCHRWTLWFRIQHRRMNTAYVEDEKNFCDVHAKCYPHVEAYWDARWEDVRPSPLG